MFACQTFSNVQCDIINTLCRKKVKPEALTISPVHKNVKRSVIDIEHTLQRITFRRTLSFIKPLVESSLQLSLIHSGCT